MFLEKPRNQRFRGLMISVFDNKLEKLCSSSFLIISLRTEVLYELL